LAIVWLVAGGVPAVAHSELATVVPSDCWHETVRVWVSAPEHVDESLPHAPALQL
jgi:hypothetical protein